MLSRKRVRAKCAESFSVICVLCFLFFFLSSSYCLRAQPFVPDNTFNPAYNFNYPIANSGTLRDSYEENDSRLLIVGYYWDNIHSFDNTIRLFDNGNIDPSWNPNAGTFFGGCNSVEKISSNYIFGRVDGDNLVKTDFSGIADMVWNYNTQVANSCLGDYTTPYVFNDGSLFVGRMSCNADSTPELRRWFVRLLPSGIIDTSFHHNTNGPVQSIFQYDSSRLLLTSGFYFFTLYDSVLVNRFCRIDTAGNLDTTFHSIFTWGFMLDCSVQPDGKIIVGGAFTIQNYPDTLGLIRLNADGSLDSTFNNFNSIIYNAPVYGYINTICPVTDGGYLVGGKFNSYQAVYRGRIAKTDANGFLDTTYFTGLGFEGDITGTGAATKIYKIKKSITADKYYAMGYFTSYNGQSSQPIIRLNGLSITGVEENGYKNNEVKVYPNPASTQLIIENGQLKIESVEVFDVLGEKRLTLNPSSNGEGLRVDVSSLSSGIYFLRIKSRES